MIEIEKPRIETVELLDDGTYGCFVVEPLKPSPPAEAQDNALPCTSVMVTIVLLNVD